MEYHTSLPSGVVTSDKGLYPEQVGQGGPVYLTCLYVKIAVLYSHVFNCRYYYGYDRKLGNNVLIYFLILLPFFSYFAL